MLRDLKRISIAAIILLVLLRVAVGWHLMYEGIWKIQSQNTSAPWSAEGYLENAQGPLRDHFRNLTGDPDDLGWLDVPTVEKRWDEWRNAFVAHYGLDEQQQEQLGRMLDGTEEFTAELEELPEAVQGYFGEDGRFVEDAREQIGFDLSHIVRYDANRKLLVVDGRQHLRPEERNALKGLVKVEKEPAPEQERQNELAKQFARAADILSRDSMQKATHDKPGLSFKERLHGLLRGNPDLYGEVYGVVEAPAGADEARGEDEAAPGHTSEEEAADEAKREVARMGKIALYKDLIAKYREGQDNAATEYQREHNLWLRTQQDHLAEYTIQQLRADVIGPVQALDSELKREAEQLLTEEQRALPVLAIARPVDSINWLTMWSLAVIGFLLIVGFFTPFAALAGAGLVLLFYLAVPPWPGVPEAPGPEHALFVNKNLIEVLALLSIALLPTGRWFGLDAVFHWIWVKMTGRDRRVPAADKTVRSTGTRPVGTPAGVR